jgi:hypothetical protein
MYSEAERIQAIRIDRQCQFLEFALQAAQKAGMAKGTFDAGVDLYRTMIGLNAPKPGEETAGEPETTPEE